MHTKTCWMDDLGSVGGLAASAPIVGRPAGRRVAPGLVVGLLLAATALTGWALRHLSSTPREVAIAAAGVDR